MKELIGKSKVTHKSNSIILDMIEESEEELNKEEEL